MDAVVKPQQQGITVRATSSLGGVWLIGWLFTISFAKLVWWKGVLGILVWPYFLGLAVR